MPRNYHTSGLAICAVMAAVAGPALAEVSFVQDMPAQSRLSSRMIGMQVFASVKPDAEAIGNVNDLVVAPDGSVQSVVLGVGGFLGVGEKNVAVPYDAVTIAEQTEGEPRLVLDSSKQELEQAPAFHTPDGSIFETGLKMPSLTGAQTAASDMMSDAQPDPQAAAPIAPQDVQAADLDGAGVYSATNERIGEVGDVIREDDGSIDALVVDFGGFLGVGEKPVEVPFETLRFTGDGSGHVFVLTDLSRKDLENAEAYDEAHNQTGDEAAEASN